MNRATIYCQTCNRPLWECGVISSGQPVVIPASPEVPLFREGYRTCPFCSQPMFLELRGELRAMIRDDGYIRVA